MKYEIRKTNYERGKTARILGRLALFAVFVFRISDFVFAAPSGASFLKIGTNARAVGMGSAYTAVADDVSSIYWNPAGLSRLAEPQVSATHAQWLSGLQYGTLEAAAPLLLWTAGVGVIYLSEGDLQGRDAAGRLQSDFKADDLAATFSLSRVLRPGVGVGVNAKYIRQTIGNYQATGIAFDAGSQFIFSRRLAAGIAVQNAGSSMKFVEEEYALPLTVSAGTSFAPFAGATFSADLRQEVHAQQTTFSVGSEFWAMNTVALRAGYNAALAGGTRPSLSADKNISSVGPLGGLGVGIGLKLFGSQVDYALVPYGDLGDTHRLSLTHRF